MEGSQVRVGTPNDTSACLDEVHNALGEPKSNVKSIQILAACDDSDLAELARLSISSGGFLQDELRRKAWPLLLGLRSIDSNRIHHTNTTTLPEHRDEAQVELDVNRSFVYYPDNDSESKLVARRSQLSHIIVATLRQYPVLCYFQGFHDIVQVLLLVLGNDLSMAAVPRLSILRIRDFMLPVLSPSFEHLQLLPAIISAVDRDLARHLAPARPFFALSSTLTMFAHDIEDYQTIARLFDFLLAHEASLSMYLFATIILSRRKELFEIEPEDTDMLHFTLSKLPKSLDLDDLIGKAMLIFEQHPPETLPLRAWARISRYSVLKTTRSSGLSGVPAIQNLELGIKLFNKQAGQINRQLLRERLRSELWKYRRPISGIGLAVLVGILSIWLQRSEEGQSTLLMTKVSSIFTTWS